MKRKSALKVYPPSPDDERYKGVKVRVFGNVLWIDFGPHFVHKEPRPARPIPPEDLRRTQRGE